MKLTPTHSASKRTNPASSSPSAGPGWRRYGLAIGFVVVIAGALGLLLVTRFHASTPAVPLPPNLEKLEPQLRDYIREKANWTQQRPRSSERQATLGLVYAGNGLWSEACRAFSNVVQLSPNEPLGHLYLAVARQETGDMIEAARLLRAVTVRFPTFAPGFFRLGEISLRTGVQDEAESAFDRLIALTPQEWRGYAGLGQVKLRQGKHAEAATLLEKAVTLDPEARSAHNLLGLAYRALGRTNDAQLELSLGLNHTSYPMPDGWSKLVPQHMRLLQDQMDIANEMAEAGHPADAVDLLEKALAYHPEHLGLLNNLAIALNRAGDPGRARRTLERALKLNDHYLPALITLAYSCQALNDNDAALAAADRAVALAPNTAQSHLARANALLGMERDAEAVAALEAASKADPKNAEIQLEMGDICWRNLQLPDEALKHYRVVTNLDPASVPVYIRLGDFHLHNRDTNAAAEIIHTLRRLFPNCPELPILEGRWRKLSESQASNRP